MAKAGGNRGGRPRPSNARPQARKGAARGSAPQKQARPALKKSVARPVQAPAEPPRTFRLGAIPGATPGKWIDVWKKRMPDVPLELVPLEVATQRGQLAEVDAALVRLPLDDTDLHVIRLYDELPVIVAPVESSLLAAEELELGDLDGEVLLTSEEDVLDTPLPGTVPSAYGAVPTVGDLVATVATGAGIALMPMSLARLHHRKDVEYRVLKDGQTSTVAFVWPRDQTTTDVDTFIGIIRGRTQNSSR